MTARAPPDAALGPMTPEMSACSAAPPRGAPPPVPRTLLLRDASLLLGPLALGPGRPFDAAEFLGLWAARAPGLLELAVEVASRDDAALEALSGALAPLLAAAAPSLESLRLGGRLSLDAALGALDLARFARLRSVHLAGGRPEGWGAAAAARALAALPALARLEVHFDSDAEFRGDVGLLEPLAALTRLEHLSLHFPLRSALPPAGGPPAAWSALSRLTALQLRRCPLQQPSPPWLCKMRALKHLYWDPYLPVELEGRAPECLSSLVGLETLYLECRPPLAVLATLTALQRLTLTWRGGGAAAPPRAPAPAEWAWMAPLSRLVSLRLQGAGLTELPEPARHLSALTRLSLMCNALRELPAGPYLQRLRALHLGGNLVHRFPPALRVATELRALHLANQRAGGAAPPSVAADARQRLVLTADDVAALLAMPRLAVVVAGSAQLRVAVGGGLQRGVDWLQRVLRARAGGGPRLATNELLYELESLEVFRVAPLEEEEAASAAAEEGAAE
jgi:Leucine-rich repeat (LRR) protein